MQKVKTLTIANIHAGIGDYSFAGVPLESRLPLVPSDNHFRSGPDGIDQEGLAWQQFVTVTNHRETPCPSRHTSGIPRSV